MWWDVDVFSGCLCEWLAVVMIILIHFVSLLWLYSASISHVDVGLQASNALTEKISTMRLHQRVIMNANITSNSLFI